MLPARALAVARVLRPLHSRQGSDSRLVDGVGGARGAGRGTGIAGSVGCKGVRGHRTGARCTAGPAGLVVGRPCLALRLRHATPQDAGSAPAQPRFHPPYQLKGYLRILAYLVIYDSG